MLASRATILIDGTPLTSPSGLRGIGRYVFELLHGLAELEPSWSDRFRLVALQALGTRGEIQFTEDLRAAAESGMAARNSVAREPMRRRRQLWLGRACQRAGAQLLHETEALGTPLFGDTPRLTTCHDLIPLRYPRHYLPTPLHFGVQWLKDWRRYGASRRVVAISQRTRNEAIELLRVRPEQIGVVPNGINLESWSGGCDADDARMRELGLASGRYLLYVGYGDFRKNVDNMFAALARVRQEERDIELVWAGSLSERLQRRVERKAEQAGVRAAVRFLGYVADDTLPTLFRRALAHLFLSRLEGFGLSVAEAMAAGCPVIVARNSGSDEVAEGAGHIVDPDDPAEAARAVLALARDPALRNHSSRLGRERVTTFSRKAMVDGYLREYAQALAASE